MKLFAANYGKFNPSLFKTIFIDLNLKIKSSNNKNIKVQGKSVCNK
jgi:hypothetical protein